MSSRSSDARMLARSLGLLWVAAPVVGLTWLLLPTHHHVPLVGAMVCVGVPWLTAAVLFSGRLDHAPPVVFQALLAVATIVVTPTVAWTADPDPAFALFYVWSTPYAFCWFSLRHAALQTALAGGCFLAVLELAHHTRSESLGGHLATVLLLVSTITATGLVARHLVQTMHRRERLRGDRQRALAEFGRASLDAPDLQSVLDQAVRVAVRELHADYAVTAEVLGGTEELRITSLAGPEGADAMQPGDHIPAGNASALGLALSSPQPILSDDLAEDPRLAHAPALSAFGMRSAIGVKLRHRTGERLGGMAVYAARRAHFSHDDPAFLQALANVVAAAIGRFAADEELRHQALHDPLTGLPNRTLLADRLHQALLRARRTPGEQVGVIVIDLDRFKTVNDSLGHPAGDEVLLAIARRLSHAVRTTDTLARLGGDEFVVVAEGVRDARHAIDIAERVATAWSAPVAVLGRPLHVQASAGVALSDGQRGADELLANADAAMYRGKELGSGGVELFDDRLRERATQALKLEQELRAAVAGEELVAHFQPIVDPADERCLGLEALVRWEHPKRGTLNPGRFIGLAEESGLIVPIGERVLDVALRQLAAWRAAGHEDLTVSVNASARQLRHPGFVSCVAGRLAHHGLPADALALELTEHVVLDPHGPAVGALLALDGLGVRIELDDFGTGFSSLSSLRTLPVSTLKIDRSFVAGLGTDPADTGVVSGVLHMARGAGLEVVAEGVETAEQARALVALGCERAQGFFYAKPLPPEEATAYLERSRATARR